MKHGRALMRLHFVHAVFFGYVAKARADGDSTSIIDIAKEFCVSQGCDYCAISLTRTYYDTLETDREFKRTNMN